MEQEEIVYGPLTPEQLKAQDKLVEELLADLSPIVWPVPSPAVVKVGDVVRIHYCGASTNEGRIGTVIEMPGTSLKYGSRPAERIEVLLHGNADYEAETIWTDNGQYSWLNLV